MQEEELIRCVPQARVVPLQGTREMLPPRHQRRLLQVKQQGLEWVAKGKQGERGSDANEIVGLVITIFKIMVPL